MQDGRWDNTVGYVCVCVVEVSGMRGLAKWLVLILEQTVRTLWWPVSFRVQICYKRKLISEIFYLIWFRMEFLRWKEAWRVLKGRGMHASKACIKGRDLRGWTLRHLQGNWQWRDLGLVSDCWTISELRSPQKMPGWPESPHFLDIKIWPWQWCCEPE